MPLLYDADFEVNAKWCKTPFGDLKDAVIGVEATSYLQRMIDTAPTQEPLLSALGGDPIGLTSHIETELDKWKDNGMRPLFVFDGQSIVGKDEMSLRKAKQALLKTQEAWDLYGAHKADEAVKAFGASGAVRAQDLYRVLKKVLIERDFPFLVAPFSACAQLAYLINLDEQYIDGIMGSNELLLYNTEVIIRPPIPSDWETKFFHGIYKSDLIGELNITSSGLSDALLMTGTSFLPPFPPLLETSIIARQPYQLVDAINLLRTSEKSIASTCAAFQDILADKDKSWLDKFQKAKMGIKHCITATVDGKVNVQAFENLTSDNNLYLGLQVPAELYHYLATGLIGPRILDCFSSPTLEIVEFPTLDGVVSDEYKRLVTRALVPLKETTAALISSRIHRAFQYKDITLKFWFDQSLKETLIHRNMQPQTNQKADTWGVKDPDLKAQETVTGATAGKLSFALLSLRAKEFASKTISKKVSGLASKPEVLSNALWRLLHLRGYVNDQHELTSWGRALAETLSALAPVIKKYDDIHRVEEGAFLAFELIRFENLNPRNRHQELIGGPLRGTEEDKANCILIGRTACLLKLRHQNLGYTGPLSKNFLAFHSIIKAVRETDRDLLEAITSSMFLSSQASRDRDSASFQDIGMSVPFTNDIDTSLGIAVKTYLDDFLKLDWTPEQREENKAQYAVSYLPHSINFGEDLGVAFDFFDAVYKGVKTLGDEMGEADKKAWEAAKGYLDERR